MSLMFMDANSRQYFSNVDELNIFLRIAKTSAYLNRKCTDAEKTEIREQYFLEKDNE